MARVELQQVDAARVVRLNRPEVRNAVDPDTMDELLTIVGRLADDADVRAVIFTGAGEDAFCAGGDLKALSALTTAEQGHAMSSRMQRALQGLASLPVPVIGVLNGCALGGGAEAILATDLRIAEEHSYLSFKQLQLGVSFGWGGAARLARDIGPRQAFLAGVLGKRLEPSEALEWGIVDEVVPRGRGMERALELARQFSTLPPLAVRALKRMTLGTEPSRLHVEAAVFAPTWGSRDHHEAVAAYFEKRTPRWEGR